MSDLVAFLRARLNEDETAAKAAADAGGDEKWFTPEAASAWFITSVAGHIVRHDPARVLREVQAKRAIVARHRIETTYVESRDDDMRPVKVPDVECFVCGWASDIEGSACDTLRQLAAVYSDHPDYQQEWTP